MVNTYKGNNQSITRHLNNGVVIDELRIHNASATELSEVLHLSNATLSSILANLTFNHLIKVSCNDSVTGLGRKRVIYSLNDEYKLGVIVSITNYNVKIALTNLHKETIFEETYDVEEYSLNTLYKIILAINNILMRKEFRDIPVGNVVISMPGLVNKNTGKLQVSPQFDKDLFENGASITNLFYETFNCPIYLENDTNLMMIGELEQGSFKNVESGLLIYNDVGLGGALEIKENLYSGSQGYAGEIGRLDVMDESGNLVTLDDLVSLRGIQNKIKEKFNISYKVKDLIKAYKDNDEIVCKEVLNSARHLGHIFKQIIAFMDVSRFVISGRCKEFGDKYLIEIKKYIQKDFPNIEIIYSSCSLDTIIEGAKKISVDSIIKDSLNNLNPTKED